MADVYVRNVIDVRVSLNAHDCPTCGVIYGLPEDLERRRREDGKEWFCPNGHFVMFTKSEVAKAREEAEQARVQLAAARADAAFYQHHADQLLADLGQKNRELQAIKKRAASGTCTECHRHFVNIERHYKTKHGAVAANQAR